MNQASGRAFERYFIIVSTMLALTVIIVPNSNRYISLPLFFLSAGLAVCFLRFTDMDRLILAVWAAMGVTTVASLMIGVMKGAQDAAPWVLFVYVVSPALWMLIIRAAFQLRSPVILTRGLLRLGFFAACSVFVYYAVFFTLGPAYLTFVIAEPNIGILNGQPVAAMHVFGSLIYICAGFFAAPQMVRGEWRRTLFGLTLLGAVVLSGRSALFTSVVVGGVIGIIANARRTSWRTTFHSFRMLILVIVLLVAALNVFLISQQVDVLSLPRIVFEKIMSGGGDERINQAASLYSGILESFPIGAGHGVGASYVRDPDQPWRYELLWLSTIYHMGVLGSAVYAIPIVVIFSQYAFELKHRLNSVASDFNFAGFSAILVGAATNPYLESFEFQWMMSFPFLYFCLRHCQARFPFLPQSS